VTRDVRLSVTLAGRHSLGPGSLRGACESVERDLLDGSAEYAIRSTAPGHEFTLHGRRDGSGLVAVRLDESSFMAVWDEESYLEVPASALDAVGRRLRPAGDVHVRIHALVTNVAMEPVKIGGNPVPVALDTTTFGLARPAAAGEDGGRGELTFSGLVARTEDATANLTIFGEARSGMPAVRGIMERALAALSAHCEAFAR